MNDLLQRACRAYPFLNGYGRIANSSLIRKVMDARFPSEISGRLNNGMHFTAPGRDFVGRAAYLFGDLDPKITEICRRIVRKGDTVVDVGANIGLFSLYASTAVGRNGMVHAVEPQPDLVKRLNQTIDRNKITNIKLHSVALGESTSIQKLTIPEGNSGAATLMKLPKNDNTIPIPVIRSGEFLEQQNLTKIRLLKLDIEGYEAHFIRGAIHFLVQHRPDAIIFEARSFQSANSNAAVSLLEEMGYLCAAIRPSLKRLRLGKIGHTKEYPGVHDMLAVAPGVVGRDILTLLS